MYLSSSSVYWTLTAVNFSGAIILITVVIGGLVATTLPTEAGICTVLPIISVIFLDPTVSTVEGVKNK